MMNNFSDNSISRIVQRIVHHLGQNDYICHVACSSGSGTMQEEFMKCGAQVIDFSQPVNSQRWVWQRIHMYLIEHNIRIIHTHTPRTIAQATLATYRLSQVIHVSTKHLLTTSQDRRWGLLFSLFDRLSLYLPNCLIAVSKTMYKQIVAQPGIVSYRVTSIPNAIPVDKYFIPEQRNVCRKELCLLPESLAVGFAGRMDKVKRIDLLLHAFRQILDVNPQARLVLVGEGSNKIKWQALAENICISHAVVWTGFRNDIPRILAALDIFVQPSVNEGLSLSVLEAMAASKPIIATDVGGTSEVIIDGVTGILIPPDSSSAMIQALLTLIENPEQRLKMAQAARKFVHERFAFKEMIDSYQQLYEELV